MTNDTLVLEKHLKKTTIITNIFSMLVAGITTLAIVNSFYYNTTNTLHRHTEQINDVQKDVKVIKEKLTNKEILIISNIDGKRGKGTCQSYYGAVKPFREILKRRRIKNPSKCDEKLFLIHHRVMFNEILKKKKLKD